MTRRPRLTFVSSDRPARDKDGAAAPQKSLGNRLGRKGGKAVPDPAPFDPYKMRAEFPELWAGYLRAYYGRAEQIAVDFGVTYQTACNWLSGVCRPSGDKVLKEVLDHPARLREYVTAHRDDAA